MPTQKSILVAFIGLLHHKGMKFCELVPSGKLFDLPRNLTSFDIFNLPPSTPQSPFDL